MPELQPHANEPRQNPTRDDPPHLVSGQALRADFRGDNLKPGTQEATRLPLAAWTRRPGPLPWAKLGRHIGEISQRLARRSPETAEPTASGPRKPAGFLLTAHKARCARRRYAPPAGTTGWRLRTAGGANLRNTSETHRCQGAGLQVRARSGKRKGQAGKTRRNASEPETGMFRIEPIESRRTLRGGTAVGRQPAKGRRAVPATPPSNRQTASAKPPVQNRIRRQVLPFKDASRFRRVRSAERCPQRESFACRPWLPRLRSRQSRPTDCRQPSSRTECCPERSCNPRLAPDAPVRTIGLEPASGRNGPPRCLQPIACRPQRRQGR